MLHQARLEQEFEVGLSQEEGVVGSLLEELFGTPDEPRIPEWVEANPEWKLILDAPSISRSAGAVGRKKQETERGLYRKHCVQCHGMNGNGAGPSAAFEFPFPRDFRRGTFKFKSTVNGAKPTHEDLVRTLEHGLPGTAMPSFNLLKNNKHYAEDIDALVHYVRYLSIRGEVERKVLQRLALAKVDGESFYDPKLKTTDAAKFANQTKDVEAIVKEVLDSWASAASKKIVADRPDSLAFDIPSDFSNSKANDLRASIARGKELFQGPIANCSICHGKTGLGNGSAQDFDEWTKDWTIRAGLDPTVKKEWKTMKKFGAIAAKRSVPRNLQLGVFRGGESPEAIYQRILGGIEGTPMPPAAVRPSNSQGMTEEQVWDLVHFVMSLQYDGEGA